MSILSRIIARLLAPFKSEQTSSSEGLSFHEWADLPPYHPRCD